MATFSFGSFGDLVTLAELAYRIYDAGSTNGSLARDLITSRAYLENLLAICHFVERTVETGAIPHTADAIAFRDIINNCSECLRKFATFLDQFQDTRQIVRVSRRLRYCLLKKNEINQFEARIQGFVVMLSILQMKFSEQGVKSQIVRSLDEPWDQRPIKFQDALGRRYPLPLEVCGTFKDFLSFIQAAFGMNEGLRKAIVQQQFWLFTPSAPVSTSASAPWYIISERHWKLAFRPGARIGMSLSSSYNKTAVPKSSTWKVAMCDCPIPAITQTEEISTPLEETRAQVEEYIAPISGDEAGLDPEKLPAQSISATQAIGGPSSSSSSINAPQSGRTYHRSPKDIGHIGCEFWSLPGQDGSFEYQCGTAAKDLNDETVKSVKFSQPMPHWASYDPKTEFQLL